MSCHAALLTAIDTETAAILDVLRDLEIFTTAGTINGYDIYSFEIELSEGSISVFAVQLSDERVDDAKATLQHIVSNLQPELLLFVGLCEALSEQVKEQDIIAGRRLIHLERKQPFAAGHFEPPIVHECSARVLGLIQELRTARKLDGILEQHVLHIGKDLASGDETPSIQGSPLRDYLRTFSTDIFGFAQHGTGVLADIWNSAAPQRVALQIGIIKAVSSAQDTQLTAARLAGKIAFSVLSGFAYAKAPDGEPRKKRPASGSGAPIHLPPSSMAALRARIATVLSTDPQFDSFCQDYFLDVFARFSVGMDRITKVNFLLQLYPAAEISARLDEYAATRSKDVPESRKPNSILPFKDASSQRKYWYLLLPLAAALWTGSSFFLKWRSADTTIPVPVPRPTPPFPGMVYLSGATFTMGSQPDEVAANLSACQLQFGPKCNKEALEREQPAHEVSVSPFFLDTTEVTNAEVAHWLNFQTGLVVEKERLVSAPGTLLLDLHPKHSGLRFAHGRFHVLPTRAQEPVVLITWDGANRYCTSLGKRLPSEAEFEYAARGVTRRTFPWGEQHPSCNGVVFGRGLEGPCTVTVARPERVRVSSQDLTSEGVFDLGGNVAEWVQDLFSRRYRPCGRPCLDGREAPSASDSGSERVIRGGYYDARAAELRGAARQHGTPGVALHNVGFRCATSAERVTSGSAQQKEGP